MGQNVIGDSPQDYFDQMGTVPIGIFRLNKLSPTHFSLNKPVPIDRCPHRSMSQSIGPVAPLPEEMLAQQEQRVKADLVRPA